MASRSSSLRSTVLGAAAVLCASGVLAGLCLRMALASYTHGVLGESAARLAAVAGVLACLAMLHAGWTPLARMAVSAATASAWALAAVVLTVGLLVVTLPIAIGLASEPYERIACADQPNTFCGWGVFVFVPTYLAVLPWTAAGLLPLMALAVAARRRQSRSR